MIQHISILASILLLPMLPAYILFKTLPSSSATVSGPLQGLQLKLGGAFGGYFAVALLAVYAHSIWSPPPPPPAYQVWTVYGNLVDDHGTPIEVTDPNYISLTPAPLQIDPGGFFQAKFFILPSPGGSEALPVLSFKLPNFEAKPILLDPSIPGAAAATVKNQNVYLGKVLLTPLQAPAYEPPPGALKPLPAGQAYQ
jgi:hypothetical protein